jgi:hypothetical protein
MFSGIVFLCGGKGSGKLFGVVWFFTPLIEDACEKNPVFFPDKSCKLSPAYSDIFPRRMKIRRGKNPVFFPNNSWKLSPACSGFFSSSNEVTDEITFFWVIYSE